MRRGVLTVLAAVFVFGGGGGFVVWKPQWFRTPVTWLLSVHTPLAPAGAIVMMLGDSFNRPALAAQLYRREFAPEVWIAQEDPPRHRLQTLQQGVPERAIRELRAEALVDSTHREAQLIARTMREQKLHQVILVTTFFHTRRARWMLRKALDGWPATIQVAGAPTYRVAENNWWLTPQGREHIRTELLKLAYYWMVY